MKTHSKEYIWKEYLWTVFWIIAIFAMSSIGLRLFALAHAPAWEAYVLFSLSLIAVLTIFVVMIAITPYLMSVLRIMNAEKISFQDASAKLDRKFRR